mmetsp:Transcript_47648/g.134251  ORF Transcript_47648/g.134251 Transcript_47648/m.134251 type:complete len:175 (+) Transcript_47648:92-616(+)
MADVESSSQRPAGTAVNNPYSSSAPTGVLPVYHPLNILWRLLYMTAALWGLHYFEAYSKLMHDPRIRHEWFKIGLAATVAILFVKAYVELYAGKLQKQKISYKEFPQSTHTVMALILLSSIAFHLALWPVFRSASMLVMFLVGMFILNFCLLVPTYVQNLVAFALLTFFIQEYS